MKQLHIVLKGTLPILQRNIRAMRGPDEPIPSPEEEAESGSYRLPDGNLCMPSAAVRNCLLRASSGRRAQEQKSGRKVLLTPLLSGAVLFADDLFPLVNDKGDPIGDYNIDIRSVKNPNTRGRFSRARARIELPWFLVCTFRYKESMVTLDLIEDVLNIGGETIGIGDYRLEKKGPFGGFEVAQIEVK